jgi:hypothetical protein
MFWWIIFMNAEISVVIFPWLQTTNIHPCIYTTEREKSFGRHKYRGKITVKYIFRDSGLG